MSQYRSCLVNFEIGLDYKKKKIGGCLFGDVARSAVVDDYLLIH